MNKLKIIKTFCKVRWFRKFKDRQTLEAYQQRELKKQLAFIKEKSPYFQKMEFEALEDLPLMDKSVMMAHFNELNTVEIDRDEALSLAIESEKTRDFEKKLEGISVGLSSGTSGHRGLFIISDDEIATWVGGIMAKLLPQGKLFNHKVAFFLRADNNLYEGANSKVLDFQYFDILKSMEDNIVKLQDFQPTILIAPPSVLMILAKAIEEGALDIQPMKVFSVAEVLTKEDEHYFEEIFKQDKIFQVYQCTEGFLGYTCEEGHFHLNEDVIYLEKEYLDERRFVPIITDFMRKSQPIIRYRLNDILVESKVTCPCGNPSMIIEKIEGRMDDIFIFDGLEGKEIQVFPDFISRAIVYVDGVREYRVYQISKEEMVVYLDKVDEEICMKVQEEFQTLAQKMRFKQPKISFEQYEVNLSRKMKRVERGF